MHSAFLVAYLLARYLMVSEAVIAHCGNSNPPEKKVSFTYTSTLLKECATASVVELPDYMVLVATARTRGFLEWVKMDYKYLRMCLSVENFDVVSMSFSAAVKGQCLGPDLCFVNNYNLQKIDFTEQSLISLVSLRASVRIRGNRHLSEEFLNEMKEKNPTWDIQDVGECYIPTPFSSFDPLVKCTAVFGTLTVDPRVQTIEEMPSNWKTFAYTGCIRVKQSKLSDISFLTAFSKYTSTPECNPYIIENKKLCPEELEFVASLFPGTLVKNNDPCRGGKLSEAFLNRIIGCSTINGNLLISNLTGLPSNINNLNHVVSINGTLTIENNRGLHKFNYFTSLERVGPENDNESLAIIVKDNPELSSLSMPRLTGIVIEEFDPKVALDNNPKLFQSTSLEQSRYEGRTTTSLKTMNKILLGSPSYVSPRDQKESLTYRGHILLSIFGTALLVILFVTVGLTAFFIVRRKKKRRKEVHKRANAQGSREKRG